MGVFLLTTPSGPCCPEAIKEYQDLLDFFAKVDDEERLAVPLATLKKIASSKATGMLLNVLVPDKPLTKVKRRKHCLEVVQLKAKEGLHIRQCILDQAQRAITQG